MGKLAGALIVVACAVLSACSGNGIDEDSGCGAPGLELSSSTVSVGDQVTVTGQNFLTACGDETVNGVSSTSDPMSNVTILLTQDGEARELGSVSPETSSGQFSFEVTIPEGTHSGEAVIGTDVDLVRPVSVSIVAG